MRYIKNIIKLIVNILTVLLIFILCLVIYGKLSITFSDNKYPNYFGYTLFEVSSGSMQPTLNINDVIIVKIKKNNLKKDDIIAFVSEDAVITHRIVFIDKDVITVKGDNNNTVDTPINRDCVIGKVIKILPNFGIWKKVIMEPKVLVAVFITLLLFDFALSYGNKDKKSKVRDKKIKKDDIKIEKIEISNDKEEKDISVNEKLLEITRSFDIEEINNFIVNKDLQLSKEEIEEVKEELDNNIDNYEDNDNLSAKQKEFLDYTVRLDLSEIQKRIDKKIR